MMHWLGPTEFDCNCDYNAWIEIKVPRILGRSYLPIH